MKMGCKYLPALTVKWYVLYMRAMIFDHFKGFFSYLNSLFERHGMAMLTFVRLRVLVDVNIDE
jgi:hypothetical protein